MCNPNINEILTTLYQDKRDNELLTLSLHI